MIVASSGPYGHVGKQLVVSASGALGRGMQDAYLRLYAGIDRDPRSRRAVTRRKLITDVAYAAISGHDHETGR